ADMLLSSKDGRSVSSVGAGKSTEKSNLTTESPLSMVVKMDPLTPSTSNSSALSAAAQRLEAPLPQGSNLLFSVAPANWTLSSSADFVVQRNVTSKAPPHSSTTGNLSTKSSSKSQTAPFSGGNNFPKKKAADVAGSFLLPHDQDYKSSSLLSKASDIRKCRSTEIDDEERFLYGDEEEKMAEQTKAQSDQTVSTSPVKSSESKQEFEKIQDLLKTIGLDIGVTEIGKLSVRTQERLHGKKVAPKITQPTAEQPQSGPMVNSAELKAKMSEPKEPEPQVKAERKEEPAMKTEPVVKPVPKEPPPPVTLPSPAPIPKEKPQLILKNPLPKETIAAPKVEVPVQLPIPCSVSEPMLSPISPSQIPVYPPYPHSPMVPGYSMPPSYNPYTPYMSYPSSSWTMYSPVPPQPPPAHIPPPLLPPISVPVSAPAPVYNPRSNLRVIETTEDLTDAKAAVKTDAKPTTSLATLLAERQADRKNKEAEKIKKVLEELGSVRKEHKAKSESLKTISTKVEQLRIQQGILLRKKQREKDGHKDPLLEELNNVLETAQKQINSLSEEINTIKQKHLQLTKVAEILAISPTDLADKSDLKKENGSSGCPALTKDSDNESRTSKSANDLKSRSNPVSDANAKSSSACGADTKILGATQLSNVTEKSEVQCKGRPPKPSPEQSPEPHSPRISKSRDKSQSKSPRPTTPSSNTPANAENPLPFEISKLFKYYDPGSHWCEDCNEICLTLLEFLLHFHDEKHKQSLKEVRRPWVKKKPQELSFTKKRRLIVPLKGAEFLLPVNGHYCELCEETFPDHIAAQDHLRTYAHNHKYKKYIEVHINYEVVRQKKKASLTAAQEMDQRMAEHKRKIAEQKFEVQACSKSKKPKKEAAPIKPKEEEPKTHGLKQNALGKPNTLPGNASTPSHSTASTTITSTTSMTSTSASPPSTSTTQPKVRPNLPSLLSIRLPTPHVTMSKPAPLFTFLSLKSSNATSKSIPIVANKPTGVFPENLVSKAFRGEMVICKESAQPESKDKTPNMEPKKTDGQSMKPVKVTKGQGMFNVLVNKNETVERQEVKHEKESSVPKLPSSWISQKSDSVPATTSHANIFGPIKPAASTGPAKVQHTSNTKSPVTNLAPSPISSTFANSSLNNSTSGLSNNAKIGNNIINPTNPQTEKAGPTLLIPPSGNVTSSLGTKHNPANPSALQQELDSYYKMIASEDDPEDLTTSEDQDLEVAPQPTNVIRTFLQTKLESPPENKVKLERVHDLVKPPIRPVLSVVSDEEVVESDMACEVPDAVLSSVSQTSGWNLMHSNYASSNSNQPFSLASGKVSMNKDPHVNTVAASENSMEDMSVYVTCDSD
ncbi:unnamed protein product, partial [Ranitomeya imitator]